MGLPIATKNALVIIVAMLVLATSLSFISIQTLTNNLQDEIIDRLTIDGFHRMNKVDRFLFERLSDIRLLTADRHGILSGERFPIEEKIGYLKDIKKEKQVYASLSLYNAQGEQVGDTEEGATEDKVKAKDFFLYPVDGFIYVDSKPVFSPRLKKPIIRFSGPVYDAEGNVSGVIVARFLLETINDIIKDEAGGGGSINIDVVDKDGLLLFSNHDQEGVSKKRLNNLPILQQLRENPEGKAVYIGSLEGEETIFIGSKQLGFSGYLGEDWSIIMSIDTSTAFAPVDELRRNIIVLTIVVLWVVLSLSLLFSKHLSKPLTSLINSASRIGEGKFDAKVDIQTGDELETLGKVFNQSVDALASIESERKRLERTKADFLSMTTHELRSPMTAMKLQLQLILKEVHGKLTPKQKESLQIVLSNTTRLNELISDFMDVSKLESAKLKFNFEKINLEGPINTLMEEMRNFMPEKQITLVLTIDKLPAIETDPNRVMQVLRNMVNNAVKFSKKKSKIIVTVRRKQDHIHFSVQDFGRGISKENQKRIFEPFNQGDEKTNKLFGGTGLGTTICKGIVESQNGKIWLKSELGKGTIFNFTLPFIPVKNIKPIKSLFTPSKPK